MTKTMPKEEKLAVFNIRNRVRYVMPRDFLFEEMEHPLETTELIIVALYCEIAVEEFLSPKCLWINDLSG